MAIKRESVDKDQGQSFEALLEQARLLENDDDAYWAILYLLGKRGDAETFEKAVVLTTGDDFERRFSALVLGCIGEIPPHPFAAEIANRLLEMLSVEQDENVISSLISSLGRQSKNPSIPLAISQFLHHPNEDVRFSLAVALGGYETRRAIETLGILMRDSSSDVRDWATFGIGTQCDLDTPEIRTALLERLDDEDEDTRAEAIFGLARRKDRRVIPAIQRDFNAGFSGALLFEAILETPDVSLLTSLKEMMQNPDFPPDEDIEVAIAACEAHEKEQQNEN